VGLTAAPFTTLQGVETSPAFSPDGSRIAFAWNGDSTGGAKGFDLYVKTIGSETLLRLTHHPSEWLSMAWSPNGTQIAFHRMSGSDTGVYVVPALGGPERKLRSTRVPYAVAAPISWSSDGKWIAFGDPLPGEPVDRILLLSVDTLETRPIPHNPKCLHEGSPVFSHSGPELAYVCVHSTTEFELYSVNPLGGTPKLITSFSNFPVGFAWTADDRKLVLSLMSDTGFELDEVLLADGSKRRLDFAIEAAWPAVAPKGDKLAYSFFDGRTNIWRKDLFHPESTPVEVITSTRAQDDAQYSPDGKHIAFASTRAGSQDIWMSDANGRNLVQVSRSIGNVGMPRWSPDGKKIAFDSRRLEIYIADVSEQLARKLVTNVPKMTTPSWSRDGKWIYFRSYEALGQKIYRCPAAGGDAVALGGQPDGTFPQESFDGDVLYFAKRNVNTGLGMLSPKGAFLESDVEGLPPIVREDSWTVVRGGVYFVPADSPRSLRYFDFGTRRVREIFEIAKDFGDGLSVSPDGRWLLYTQVDEENSDIMLVDRFK
jgi:Tol biopolymer transport system component